MTLGRPGDLLAARYRLDRPMGSTGTAQLGVTEHWQAYDERLARGVTVRLTEALGGTPAAGSAQAMLTSLAQLNHPNVAAVYDVGVTDELGGIPVGYAISEWTEGRTLWQIMASGPQPWPRTSDWGRQIAGGLAALHAIGIAHGALGPNSIAIHDDRQVKILDAGLVPGAPQQAAGSFEQTVVLGGTAPDGTALLGRYAGSSDDMLPVGAADDVYALGALVWLATVGAMPVFGVDGVHGPDRSPLLEAGAPPELAALLAEMLDVNPAHRPTAAAVERRLGPFAATERIADAPFAPTAVIAQTEVLDSAGGTAIGARVSTGGGGTGAGSRARAAAAAAAAERDRRRRRGLLLGLALLLAGVGVAVGLIMANTGTSSPTNPVTSATDTATTAASTAAVTLPSGSTSPSPSASSAAATSAAPSPSASTAATSASPSPSHSPSPSASASATSSGNGPGTGSSHSASATPSSQG